MSYDNNDYSAGTDRTQNRDQQGEFGQGNQGNEPGYGQDKGAYGQSTGGGLATSANVQGLDTQNSSGDTGNYGSGGGTGTGNYDSSDQRNAGNYGSGGGTGTGNYDSSDQRAAGNYGSGGGTGTGYGNSGDTGNYGSTGGTGTGTYDSSDQRVPGHGGTGQTGGYGQTGGEYGSNKPGLGDKIKGTAEMIAGKATGKESLVNKGQERKSGNNY